MDSNIFYAIIDAANHLTNNPTANEREHPDDVARIEQMIGADPDLVHAREEFTEETPLHKAAGAFVPTVAELLLCHGADVNALAQTSTPCRWRSRTNTRKPNSR